MRTVHPSPMSDNEPGTYCCWRNDLVFFYPRPLVSYPPFIRARTVAFRTLRHPRWKGTLGGTRGVSERESEANWKRAFLRDGTRSISRIIGSWRATALESSAKMNYGGYAQRLPSPSSTSSLSLFHRILHALSIAWRRGCGRWFAAARFNWGPGIAYDSFSCALPTGHSRFRAATRTLDFSQDAKKKIQPSTTRLPRTSAL